MRLLAKNIPTFTRAFFSVAQFVVLMFFISAVNVQAQDNEIFTLTADALQDGKSAELTKAGWKYHAGDNLDWANPNFDDSAWETLKDTALTRESLPQTGWNGIGWFRLRLNAAPELAGISLNLEAVQLGASEIYLDGKLIKRYGTVGDTLAGEVPYNPNAEPLGIIFDGAGEHLLPCVTRIKRRRMLIPVTANGFWEVEMFY